MRNAWRACVRDRMKPAATDQELRILKACTDALIVRQASLAGGSGARCAPGGEREGRSPLAKPTYTAAGSARDAATSQNSPTQQRGARGTQPPHMRNHG